MGMYEESGQISRLTFEEVQKNQDELKHLIKDKLEKGKKLTKEEYEKFDAIYARATLGFGVDQPLEPNPNNTRFGGLGNECLDSIIECYAFDYDEIPVWTHGVSKSRRVITNAELWRKIRKTIWGCVRGKALQLAVKLSPEKEWGRQLHGPGGPKP